MSRPVFAGLLCLLALAGCGLLLHATRSGVGLMPDSADYLAAADNLLKGNGLVVGRAGGATAPYVLWPPLYPFSLVPLTAAGLPLVESARWLGCLLFGVIILLAGIAARHYGRSRIAGVAGAALVLACPPLLDISSWAQSEPLLIALALPALLLLDRYVESGSPRPLVPAALLAGLASLARNSGLAVVLAGAALLLWKRRRGLAIFLPLALAPSVLWLARNLALGSTGRTLLLHLPARWKIGAALDTLALWLTGPVAGQIKLATGLLALAVVVLLVLLRRRYRPAAPAPARALLLFIPVYLLVVLLSITFLDAFIPLDSRLLSPLLPALIVLGTALGADLFRAHRPRRLLRPAIIVLGAALLLAWTTRSARWTAARSRDGAWYSSADWRETAVLDRSRDLDDDVPAWSNVPEAVWLITGRPASPVPELLNHHTGRANPAYLVEIDSLRARLRDGAVLVYVRREEDRRWYLPSEKELIARLGLQALAILPDGNIYTAGQP
jgi:hypothetical protein